MEDHHGRAGNFSQMAHAGYRLDFRRAGAGGGVVDGPCPPLGQKPSPCIGDDRVILGMDAGQRTGRTRDAQHLEDGRVG